MICEREAVRAGTSLAALKDHFQGRAYAARVRGDYAEAARCACAASSIGDMEAAIWGVCLLIDNPENNAT